jgi:hypothetical protein
MGRYDCNVGVKLSHTYLSNASFTTLHRPKSGFWYSLQIQIVRDVKYVDKQMEEKTSPLSVYLAKFIKSRTKLCSFFKLSTEVCELHRADTCD